MKSTHPLLTRLLYAILLVALAASLPGAAAVTAAPPPPEGTPAPAGVDPDLERAFQNALYGMHAMAQAGPVSWQIDHVEYSSAGTEAVLWLAPVNTETGEVIPTEDTPSPARKVTPKGEFSAQGTWKITLPGSAEWESGLRALPDELGREYIQQTVLEPGEKTVTAQAGAPFSGYKLPWAKGLGKYLSGSIGHYLIYKSCSEARCRYAYDFYDPTNRNFPLLAAKGGVVYGAKWACPNNTSTCTNYIALKDESTSPTTYQIYLHMAYDSIPAELRTVGALVRQGQYIGNVDNTGYSSGSHVHFMVVTNPYIAYSASGDTYVWGSSVDITFDDVSVNGGRPRTKYEATTWPSLGSQWMPNDLYFSGNQGTNPPTGDLAAPEPGSTLTSRDLLAVGWGADDRAVTKMQVMANYDGTWRPIGPALTTSPFATNIDLCGAGVPEGPVSLALYVFDMEGNRALGMPGLRQIYNDACHSVPPPPCNPGPDQIGIYSQPNFGGTCKLLGKGDYPDKSYFSPVSGGQIASIQVGDNVQALLYATAGFGQRPETLRASDRNLADNRTGARLSTDPNTAGKPTGAGTVESLRVQARQNLPYPPVLNYPANGEVNLGADGSQALTWRDAGGATEFRAELYQGSVSGTPYKSLDWQRGTTWYLGTLPATSFTWRVQARNENGASDWSSATFTLKPGAAVPAPAYTAPFVDNFEGDTSRWLKGKTWHVTTRRAASGANSFWMGYDASGTYAGLRESGLTSPGINIPKDGRTYYLRFNYWAQTESPDTWWDARLVQISQDGGPFETVWQLGDDQPTDNSLPNLWHASPAINLGKYAGHWIRIRFQFTSGDAPNYYLNGFEGWYVDDVRVTADPPSACNTPEGPINSPAAALPAKYGDVLRASICPAGEIDYFKFSGKAGDHVVVDLRAKLLNPSSQLDAVMALLDGDGRTVLAESDDRVRYEIPDPLINYVLPADGTYYVRVRDYSHPGAGSKDHFYDLSLYTVSSDDRPAISLAYPASNAYIGQKTPLIASVSPGGSPISRVEFFYHNRDWENGKWVLVGSDTNGADGWSAALDTTQEAEGACPANGQCPAVFARVYDSSGSWRGTIAWNLGIDNTPPTSSMSGLPGTVNSGAFRLSFTGSDALSGLAAFDAQFREKGGAWQDLGRYAAESAQAWFIGSAGRTYEFQARGVDRAGNAQAYPNRALAATTIASACTNDAYDSGTNDNTRAAAKPIALGETQTHVFCAGDEDWVKFTPQAGQEYLIWGLPAPGSAAAPDLKLYDANGTAILGIPAAGPVAGAAVAWWTAPDSRTYYLQARPQDARVVGSAVKYLLRVGTGTKFFLPIIGR